MRPLLIASLGNPGAQYAATRHSAGHMLLKAIAQLPDVNASQQFRRSGDGMAADSPADPSVRLWQSGSYMNSCGKGLSEAWAAFIKEVPPPVIAPELQAEAPPALRQVPLDPLTAKPIVEPRKKQPQQNQGDSTSPLLIVLHDELELDLGTAKLSSGAGRSARGHNGLKSALAMSRLRDLDFVRVGIGIGPRPVSRSSDQVARFVLARMSRDEQDEIGFLAVRVWHALQKARQGFSVSGKV